MDKDIHECERYKGKIGDVTFNQNGDIFCKSCGEKLKESQVDPKTLALIKAKTERNRAYR